MQKIIIRYPNRLHNRLRRPEMRATIHKFCYVQHQSPLRLPCTQNVANEGAPATLTGFFHVPIDVSYRVNVYIILSGERVCVSGCLAEVVTQQVMCAHNISTTTTNRITTTCSKHALFASKRHPAEYIVCRSVCLSPVCVYVRLCGWLLCICTSLAGREEGVVGRIKQTSKHEKITRVFRLGAAAASVLVGWRTTFGLSHWRSGTFPQFSTLGCVCMVRVQRYTPIYDLHSVYMFEQTQARSRFFSQTSASTRARSFTNNTGCQYINASMQDLFMLVGRARCCCRERREQTNERNAPLPRASVATPIFVVVLRPRRQWRRQ